MNHLDLFSGIGGFALATELAGLPIEHRCFSEIEPYASKVYHQHFRQASALGDVRRINGHELRERYPGKWILTGGFPCQDISSAGSGTGITGGRSSLWWEMHRLIDELRPEIVIAENVPALCSRGLERVLFSLAKIGFDAEWEVISAASIGAPHLRQRIWIVAYSDRLSGNTVSPTSSFPRDVGNRVKPHSSDATATPWINREAILATGTMDSEPCIYRMDDGIPGGVDNALARIRACGNAIVPHVAANIMRQVVGAGLSD